MPSDNSYIFGRGYLSSTRLNYQNYLWADALGFSLHPSIASLAASNPSLALADVATGTGLWLVDAAKALPATARLDGFDVSAAQFPHARSLPANVRLRALDASAPPPAELRGQYDAVHVRLLLGVVDGADPRPFLSHCTALLKPGGVLQWDEMDPAALTPLRGPDVPAMPCLDQLAHVWNSTKDISWIARLPEILEATGYEIVASESHHEKSWQRQMMMDIWCLVADDFAAGLPPERAEGVKALSAGAEAEVRQGAYYSQTFRVVVGRLQVGS